MQVYCVDCVLLINLGVGEKNSAGGESAHAYIFGAMKEGLCVTTPVHNGSGYSLSQSCEHLDNCARRFSKRAYVFLTSVGNSHFSSILSCGRCLSGNAES